MHRRAVQALIVIFPEDLPIALDVLQQHMTYLQILERPRSEPIQREIETPVERRRSVGQCCEYEPAPLLQPDLVQWKIRQTEAV